MEWIAHRAANLPSTAVAASRVADVVELDVHLFRNRLEVRHGKVLWPFARLWEKWELLPLDSPRPTLREIVDAIPDDVHLWLDLKGFRPRLTRLALDVVGDRRPLTASSRSWWVLKRARRESAIRTMFSVGSRWQRWLVTRMSFPAAVGVVIHERLVDADSLARLHRNTPLVVSWGVTDPVRARELRDLGISGLIIDDLSLIERCDPAE